MSPDDFVKIVRRGGDKLRVDELVLTADQQKCRGKGVLRISDGTMEIDMSLKPGEKPPATRSGVFTAGDLWVLEGVIEDDLPFRSPVAGPSTSSIGQRAVLTFDIHPIELIPTGWDAMSREERAQTRAELIQRHLAITSSTNQAETPIFEPEQKSEDSVYFYAVLFKYPIPTLACEGTQIIERNPFFGERQGGRLDTVKGELENFTFAFIKEKAENDLHVHLESKAGYSSPSEQDDWRKFFALMKALSFVQGVHAWPYRIEYQRRGRKITDRVTATRKLAKTIYTPFHLMSSHFRDTIRRATEFFENDTPLSAEIARILFLFREAGNKNDITTLTLCTLFESLVRLLFKYLNLEEAAVKLDPSLRFFETAKRELCGALNQKILEKDIPEEGAGYERLRNYIGSAQIFSTEKMFRAVTHHFGLEWENDMQEVFDTWRDLRNPLAHGHERSNLSEDQWKRSMLGESRLAGVINILLLKLFGYSGKMSASILENKYRDI
jgi:hypothetical protein